MATCVVDDWFEVVFQGARSKCPSFIHTCEKDSGCFSTLKGNSGDSGSTPLYTGEVEEVGHGGVLFSRSSCLKHNVSMHTPVPLRGGQVDDEVREVEGSKRVVAHVIDDFDIHIVFAFVLEENVLYCCLLLLFLLSS